MKKQKWLIGCLTLLSALVLGFTACAPNPDPNPNPDPGHGPGSDPNHVCETKCPECGLCLDMECTESACAEKCGDTALYNGLYYATDVKVAKAYRTTNIVNTVGDYVDNFNKTNEASLVFSVDVEKNIAATLMLTVSMTDEADVYTDSVDVLVNNQKISRGTFVPAQTDSSSSAWVEINLGCIDLIKGVNEITFIAQGDGARAHNFQRIELLLDADITLVQATAHPHECGSVCPTCGGCLNYTCFNPGCATKCTDMTESKEEAHLFCALDDRVSVDRNVNAEHSGYGVNWNSTTTMIWNIYSPEDVTVEFGAVISTRVRATVHFTTQFPVTVNGQKVIGEGYCPTIEEEGVKYAPDDFDFETNNAGITGSDITTGYNGDGVYGFNLYKLTVVGKMNLKKGANVIQIVQDLTGRTSANWKFGYNFQTLVLFSDLAVDWYESEHTLMHHEAVGATCSTNGTEEYWECTDDDCGKLFADNDGIIEVTLEEITIPADESAHQWVDETTQLVCDVCDTIEANIFAGLDDRVIYEVPNANNDGFRTGNKKVNDNYIPGSRGFETHIKYYINSDRDTTAYLWTNVSAMGRNQLIRYDDTWTVEVNGVAITTDTIHHHIGQTGASDQFTDFLYEYVCEIELKEGVNLIEFIQNPEATRVLNFRSLALAGTDAELQLVEKPEEAAPEAVEVALPTKEYLF